MPLEKRQGTPVELLHLLIHGSMSATLEDRQFGVGDPRLKLAGKPRGGQHVALAKCDLGRGLDPPQRGLRVMIEHRVRLAYKCFQRLARSGTHKIG